MPVNSKQKGSRGEREAAEFLRSIGYADARRTQQFSGDNGDSDVICPESLPHLFIEVKFGYPLKDFDLGSVRWLQALNRMYEQANPSGKFPVMLWRPKRCREWRLTFPDMYAWRLTFPGMYAFVTMVGDWPIKMALQHLELLKQ